MLLLFLSLVYAAPRSIVSVREDYGGAPSTRRNDWFRIALQKPANVTHVMLCSELMVPRPGTVGPDIDNCRASNLIRIQMYPGVHAKKDDGQTSILVDPNAFGSIWSPKQSVIIIKGTIDKETDLEQICRFNPIQPMEKAVESKIVAPKPLAVSTGHDDMAKVAIPSAASHAVGYSYTLIMTGVFGITCMCITIALVLVRRYRGIERLRLVLKNDDPPLDEDDFTVIDADIFRRLGSGVSPAFVANL